MSESVTSSGLGTSPSSARGGGRSLTAFCFSIGLGFAETGGGGVTVLGGMAGTCNLGSFTRESAARLGTLAWGRGLAVLTACLGGLTAFFCGAAFTTLRAFAFGGRTLSALRFGLDLFAGEAATSGSVTSVTS